ncbi:MAG: fused MFS/spermidine synthase, partial [Verrucomicrobiota bacterium]
TVLEVAKKYFYFRESTNCMVNISDGRVFLRRTEKKYDVILMDAYSGTRYGSFIPYHLATREFLTLAKDRLTDDGVLAYNVIGTFQGMRADVLGAMYRTMHSVFPHVYMFPARDSLNVVIVATKTKERMTPALLYQRANDLIRERVVMLPTFRTRAAAIVYQQPPAAPHSPILIDDFAPVDGLLKAARQ